MILEVTYAEQPFKKRKAVTPNSQLVVHSILILHFTLSSLNITFSVLRSRVPSRCIFSNALGLHLKLQVVFTQDLKKELLIIKESGVMQLKKWFWSSAHLTCPSTSGVASLNLENKGNIPFC